MPRVSIDFSEAQSRKPVPDGQYAVKILEVTGPHKGPKASYLTFVLEITDGEFEGRRFYHNLVIEGAGAGRLAEFIEKVTGNEIDFEEDRALDIDTDDFVGATLGIITKQREYPEGSGEFQSEVKKVLAAR